MADSELHAAPFAYRCPLCDDIFASPSAWALKRAIQAHDDIDHGIPMYGGADPTTCEHDMIDVTTMDGQLLRRYCTRCGTDDATIEEDDDADSGS
jgi:uncharacterized C2H2 Zn-finger protein